MDSSSQQIDPQPSTSSIEDDASANDQQCQPKVIELVATQSASKARGSLSHKGMEKSSDKRVHISQLNKAKIVEFSVKNPSMKYQDILLWAKDELKLSELPSLQQTSTAKIIWYRKESAPPVG
jgi:hypothetical protein